MNIAIIVPALRMGGAERAAALLGDYYSDKGHKVFYLLLADSGHSFFQTKGEIINTHIFFPLQGAKTSENIRGMFFSARTLKKIKRELKIDVSVSYMESSNFLNICSAGRERVVLSVHTVLSERGDFKGFLYDKKLIEALYRRAGRIVAVSDYVKWDLACRYRIPDKKIVSIPNVPYSHKPMLKKEAWKYGEKTLVCVGRLEPVKQQDRILRAFSFVWQRQPGARLLFVGDGKQMNYLKTVCKMQNLDETVIFTGAVSDVGYYLQHARAFIMSSRVEGFPNVMVEAMSYGAPVITTDSYGGCGEIVGKIKSSSEIQYCEYGILTPHIEGRAELQTELSREERLLGEAMLRILEDDGLYEKYSRKSTERAMDFSEEKVMALWDEVLFGHSE